MDLRAGYYAAIDDAKRDDINKIIHVLQGAVPAFLTFHKVSRKVSRKGKSQE